jgi:hypothetical protein
VNPAGNTENKKKNIHKVNPAGNTENKKKIAKEKKKVLNRFLFKYTKEFYQYLPKLFTVPIG